jgi:hypothetical protein
MTYQRPAHLQAIVDSISALTDQERSELADCINYNFCRDCWKTLAVGGRGERCQGCKEAEYWRNYEYETGGFDPVCECKE